MFNLVLLLYIAVTIAMLVYSITRYRALALTKRVETLTRQLAYTELPTVGPTRAKDTGIFRDLQFNENWENEKVKSDALRLIEFGRYADDKGNFKYAEKLYREAKELQDSLTATYYLGRNAYFQGDLSEAERNWRKLISVDPDVKYPDVRLYLATLLSQSRRNAEAKQVLATYVGPQVETTATARLPEQIPEGANFGISDATLSKVESGNAKVQYILKMAIIARSNIPIDHSKVTIQVFFYDTLDDNRLVLADADVNYEWLTPRHDWTETNPEILSVSYSRPPTEAISSSHRKYHGYLIRVYYNGQLQAVRAEPNRLLDLFPPPLVIPIS